mmetsp:Transcript_48373/g.80224  ORF Transcript_48373/g.80224 Transcript_48373/m.80224 type:complete len:106 (-) Transcript_48373:1602-1919(-)
MLQGGKGGKGDMGSVWFKNRCVEGGGGMWSHAGVRRYGDVWLCVAVKEDEGGTSLSKFFVTVVVTRHTLEVYGRRIARHLAHPVVSVGLTPKLHHLGAVANVHLT